jgi:mRNA interferase RelE/StbE
VSRYSIRILPSALKELESLPVNIRRRITAKIDGLVDDPRPEGCRKLTGAQNIYRLRQGDYRVVYEVQDQVLLVLVIRLGHRKDIYRRKT